MKKKTIVIIIFSALVWAALNAYNRATQFGAPPYTAESDEPLTYDSPFDEYANWKRPDGPIRIGLQAGHWKTDEMPEELARIRDSGGGAAIRGTAEWELVLAIAEKTKVLLEAQGYTVDLLPATVPTNYWADAFISIHADGNLNPAVRGYKVAANARDRTDNAEILSDILAQSYGDLVGFPEDPNITRNMTRYYAFNSRRYDHAIHPMTPGVLIETGFITNYTEAQLLINQPEIPAQAISQGIINFIETLTTID